MDELDEWERRALRARKRLDEADPIWGEVAIVYETDGGGWVVKSARSGNFFCPAGLHGFVHAWPAAAKARLTTWISDQNSLNRNFPVVTHEVAMAAYHSKPLRYSAKVDRLFAHLAQFGYRPGDLIVPNPSSETAQLISTRNMLMRIMEATGQPEYYGLITALVDDGTISSKEGRLTLSAKGLTRLEEQHRQGAATDQAFVAMWFSDETEAAYQSGFAPGLADAGYRALKINDKEHSNKIDDEIIAEIRLS